VITVESYREIEGPDAQALADVAGELMDIVFAHRAVRDLLGSWPPGAPYGPDTTEARALWVPKSSRSYNGSGGRRSSFVRGKRTPAPRMRDLVGDSRTTDLTDPERGAQ